MVRLAEMHDHESIERNGQSEVGTTGPTSMPAASAISMVLLALAFGAGSFGQMAPDGCDRRRSCNRWQWSGGDLGPQWSAARDTAVAPAIPINYGVAILRYLERRREAHLSTQPACSQTASRVPQADGDERRPPGAGSATRERPQKAIGVSFCPRGPANRLLKHLRNARSFCVSEAEHVGAQCPLSWRRGHVA